MEQDVNVMIEQYKTDLIRATQESGLPIGIVKYVFNDLNNEIQFEYNKYIQQKQAEMNAAMQQAQVEEEAPSEEQDETV